MPATVTQTPRLPTLTADILNATAATVRPVVIGSGNVRAAANALTHGSDPVLLVVPGTSLDHAAPADVGGASFAVAAGLKKMLNGHLQVGVLAYDDSLKEAVHRYVTGAKNGEPTLDATLKALHAKSPARPVYIAAESQGAWVAANALASDSTARKDLTRAILYATPGFAQKELPAGSHAARTAQPTRATPPSKVLEIDHSDDAIPGMFTHMNLARFKTIGTILLHGIEGKGLHNIPHHYTPDALAGISFLATGQRPVNPTHPSSIHYPVDSAHTPTT